MRAEELKEWYIKNNKLYCVSMELTQRCNFKCKHCYCIGKNEENLPYPVWKGIIDKIAETGCIFLNFTGGEILTHKDFQKIYEYAKDKGFIIDLLTNASLIDERIIHLFCELPPRKIAITLYGTNDEEYELFAGTHDGFKKVMRALQLLKENKINFSLRTIATKSFYDSLRNGFFEKIANKFGVQFRYDPIIFPQISGNKSPLNEQLAVEEIVELENCDDFRKKSWIKILSDKKAFHWKCRAGVNSFAIDFQGNAFVCGLYRSNPISVIKSDIESVMYHLRELHSEHIRIIEHNECAICSNRYICKWCPAYAKIFNESSAGDSQRIQFFCDLAKLRESVFKCKLKDCGN